MNQPQVSLGNSTGGDAEEEEEEEEVNQHQEEAESRDQIVVEEKSAEGDDQMEVDPVSPATVFCVTLKQPNSNLLHKMSVPELCRNFRSPPHLLLSLPQKFSNSSFLLLFYVSAVAWCGKLNAIACASETCARIPRFDFFLFPFQS